MTARADSYLTLPPEYSEESGGLQWSHRCDAVELADGRTVALAEEIAEVLAGVFASGPPVPHFAHVLHAYFLMKCADLAPDDSQSGRVRRVFGEFRSAPGAYRNAGRLIAHWCRDVPPPPAPPTWDELSFALIRLKTNGPRWRPQVAIEPSLAVLAFHRHLCEQALRFDKAALRRWFTRGADESPDPQRLTEAVEALPARVLKALALAAERPRLAAAAALVPVLDAAVALPPRRPKAGRVPQGGYADVTTRGDPGRLLPSQLALDPDEFVRRFAANELLFFEREEPHKPAAPTRVVVLDQGVRTWGSVRLALAAAAAALLAKEPKKAGRIGLLTTALGRIDVDLIAPAELADLLEASDLTAHPGEALASAVQNPTIPQDVILLTHPRSLNEPAVRSAAAARGPDDRLFAVAVDDAGRAELHEWGTAGPVPVRAFRIDLAAAEAVRVKGEPPPPRPAADEWTGDREPIGFPFRPGLVGGDPAVMGFDADGEVLVVVTRDGVPHLLRLDGSPPEVLPRGMADGEVLRLVTCVLGVQGGFALCGRAEHTKPTRYRTIVAHYDLGTRTVRTTCLFEAAHMPMRWAVDRPRHAVGFWLSYPAGEYGRGWHAFSLTAGQVCEPSERLTSTSGDPPYLLPVLPTESGVPLVPGWPSLIVRGGSAIVSGVQGQWNWYAPTEQGQPSIPTRSVDRAVLAGETLALRVNTGRCTIHLVRGPAPTAVRIIRNLPQDGPFALSPDGRRIATTAGGGVTVSATTDAGPLLAAAARGRLHSGLQVFVAADPFRLVVQVGRYRHTFTVPDGGLVHTLERDPREAFGYPGKRVCAVKYDSKRFLLQRASLSERYVAVVDTLGQVVIVTPAGGPVAAFVVRREKAAGWLPGGVFWGDAALTGRAASPTAAAAFGLALGDLP